MSLRLPLARGLLTVLLGVASSGLGLAQGPGAARPLAPVCCEGVAIAAPPVSSFGVTLGGNAPDVPWFTLPMPSYGPAAGPGTVVPPVPPVLTGNHAPYSSPIGLFITPPADNPAVAGIVTHANITRFWAANPTYTIVIPPLGGGATPLGNTVQSSFPTMGAPNSSFTWGRWVTAVNQAFAAYSNSLTSSLAASFAGFSQTDYRTPANGGARTMPAGFLQTGQFVWSSAFPAPNAGPTGNGINEIILADHPLGGIGITSMLLDPTTGSIIECDVIIDVFGVMQPDPNTGGRTSPREWTALRHEIGHFFGLDHTNLHPGRGGAAPAGGGNFGAAPNPGSTPSIANFGAATPIGTLAPVPGMVGVITHLGSGFNHAGSELHPDDQVSLAKIYPVTIPTPGSTPPRLPLINTRARIIGRLTDAATPNVNGNPTGTFARNVWVTQENYAPPSALYPAFPFFGSLSATARLSATEASLLTDPLLYQRPAMHNVFAPLPPGPFFLEATSVVGATNGATESTGDFSLDGLIGGTFDDVLPIAYEVAFEDGGSLGVSSFNQAEWFNETSGAFSFYLGNPPGSAPPWGATVMRNFFGAAFGSNTVSAMRGVPGTVIALDPGEHDESTLAPVPGGSQFNVINDFWTRPLVDIQPRTGRAASGTLTIDARSVVPTMVVDAVTARLFLNGVEFTASLPIPTGTALGLRWSIPMATVLALAPSSPVAPGAVLVQFVVREFHPDPFVQAYSTFGRNDVWL